MTEAVVRELVATGASVTIVDTSGAVGGSRLRYHVSRMRGHLYAARILGKRRKPKTKTCYLSGAAGLGIWYLVGVALVARLLRYRLVYHHHNFSYLVRRRAAVAVLVRVSGVDAHHVVLCEGMSQLLAIAYPSARRILVCSNAGLLPPLTGVNGARVPDHSKEPTLTLGHLSNLSVEKGLDLVFETMRLLQSHDVRSKLLLAGPSWTATAEQLLQSARDEFGDSLQYLGALKPSEVRAYFESLDIFLFPSRNEAEPLVLIEAAQCGVPVVAFDIGCIAGWVDRRGLIPASGNYAKGALRLVEKLIEGNDCNDARRRVRQHYSARYRQAAAGRRQLLGVLLQDATIAATADQGGV